MLTADAMLAFYLAWLCFFVANQEMACLKMYSGFWCLPKKILSFRQTGCILDTFRFIWQRHAWLFFSAESKYKH